MTAPQNPALAELLGALSLEETGPGRYRAGHISAGGGRTAYGGQLLAQTVVAAAAAAPDKSVKSLHAMFVRGVSLDSPGTVGVEVMHSGRMYTSTTVDVTQDGQLCARALVLLDRADAELARHSAPMPAAAAPGPGDPIVPGAGGAEVSAVGGVDLNDPAASGPPEYRAWVRFPGAPADATVNQALLALAGEPYFFGLALRPHEGLSQALAYREVIPSVITHSVFFHGPFSASDWLLFDLHSPHLGRGRIFGYGSVFTAEGELVASITQENQLRPMSR